MQELFNKCVNSFNFRIQSYTVKCDYNQVMGLSNTDKDSENNKKLKKQESYELNYKEHNNIKSSQEMKVNDLTLFKQPV